MVFGRVFNPEVMMGVIVLYMLRVITMQSRYPTHVWSSVPRLKNTKGLDESVDSPNLIKSLDHT